MLSTAELPMVKMGYLHKRARKSGRNWRRRWMVINLEAGVVSYYKTRKAHDARKKPTGSVQLPKRRRRQVSTSPRWAHRHASSQL